MTGKDSPNSDDKNSRKAAKKARRRERRKQKKAAEKAKSELLNPEQTLGSISLEESNNSDIEKDDSDIESHIKILTISCDQQTETETVSYSDASAQHESEEFTKDIDVQVNIEPEKEKEKQNENNTDFRAKVRILQLSDIPTNLVKDSLNKALTTCLKDISDLYCEANSVAPETLPSTSRWDINVAINDLQRALNRATLTESEKKVKLVGALPKKQDNKRKRRAEETIDQVIQRHDPPPQTTNRPLRITEREQRQVDRAILASLEEQPGPSTRPSHGPTAASLRGGVNRGRMSTGSGGGRSRRSNTSTRGSTASTATTIVIRRQGASASNSARGRSRSSRSGETNPTPSEQTIDEIVID